MICVASHVTLLPMSKLGNRVKERRLELGLSQDDLAKLVKTSQQSIGLIERGERRRPRKLKELADALNVSQDWLLGNTDAMSVESGLLIPVVGYVGAGAEFDFIDDYEKGAGFETVEAPPGTPRNAIAVMIRGKSEYPVYDDGDILLYWSIRYDVDSFLNTRCVCRLADGRTVIKTPTRGSQNGLFTLLSFNAPPIEDVVLEWCAKIKWVKPR